MSRLTGSDALGLYEAYQAVYNPQQYSEDQLWEEVEYWVDDLMREGYDLSDYTWEEIYETYNYYNTIVCYLLDEGYADTNESALVIMANMSEEWREGIVEGLVDAVASGAGTVVGTAQRAAREIPKYVQQKVKNVAGTYEYARQRADANPPSREMTTSPRSREFSHGNLGGKPPMKTPMKPMKNNPGPNFGRG